MNDQLTSTYWDDGFGNDCQPASFRLRAAQMFLYFWTDGDYEIRT